MEFTKMQGIGNDYVYVDCFKEKVEQPERAARFVSDRHFGVGSDGLILICPSDRADCRMEMYNADGSLGLMCGNGIRCVGKYVYDHGIVSPDKREVTVDTASGIKRLSLLVEQGKVSQVTVDMGEGKLTSRLPETIRAAERDWEFVGIDMGNPHAVCRVEDTETVDLERVGPAFEYHPRFMPHRVNTEFIQILDRKNIRMRVWERGSGETWACGTGACASAFASILSGWAEDEVRVFLRGGSLSVCLDRETNHLFMTGPAVEVFRGDVEIPPEF